MPEQPSDPLPRGRLPALIGLGAAGALLLAALAVIAVHGGPLDGERVELAGRGETARLFGGLEQKRGALGPGDAPVAIGVFNDLQCARCAAYALRTVPRLVEGLVRPGRARLVFHHFPMGARERGVAGLAAAAAGEQGREWQYAYLFFRNQERVRAGGVTERFLRALAGADPRLDLDRWRRDRDGTAVERRLAADARLARDLRLPAEPAIAIDGRQGSRKLTGSPSPAAIEAAVRAVR